LLSIFSESGGELERVIAYIDGFNLYFGLKSKGWQREAGDTMFNVVNAYTRAAQFEGLSAESSYRLQKVGGMILEMVK
jgi:hypothetical protein